MQNESPTDVSNEGRIKPKWNSGRRLMAQRKRSLDLDATILGKSWDTLLSLVQTVR
jgi:hypothetical protein